MSKGAMSAKQELILLYQSPEINDDPYAFVLAQYPWGVDGTPLASYDGPRQWQRDDLMYARDHILENRNRIAQGKPPLVLKRALASGRGIGKSALFSWLADWNWSCHIGSSTIISANSEDQLNKVTWGELGRWRQLALNNDFSETTATAVLPKKWYADALKSQLGIGSQYYYIQAKLWSEERPDAYAGAHNPLGMMLLFDEASGIPTPIWNVAEGYFTEPVLHRYWWVFSNPRRGTGAFFECFHKYREFWTTKSIDARTVEGTDKEVYNRIIAQHGEDSDIVRIEVKGEFPRFGDKQFIPRDAVLTAMARTVPPDPGAPLIMGVDVAGPGEDSTVLMFRKGRDGKVIPPIQMKIADTMEVTYAIARVIDKHKPDAVNIDQGNMGYGVVSRLKELGYRVNAINFGAESDNPTYKYKRTAMWGAVKEDLPDVALPDVQDLLDDLTGPEWKHHGHGGAIILESKDAMKSRGLHSPDFGDAWALTYAVPVARLDIAASRALRGGGVKVIMGHPQLRRK